MVHNTIKIDMLLYKQILPNALLPYLGIVYILLIQHLSHHYKDFHIPKTDMLQYTQHKYYRYHQYLVVINNHPNLNYLLAN